ncbi:High-affinity nicotinic acid transporter [Xanthoria parietina]
MICQGFVQNYSGLIATRFFLGLAEAGIFPGSFYLISFWYKREEAQQRFTVYWCSVLTASMFGGLLASAIANMDGIRGLSSWRWIFILEGIATVAVGFAAFFLVSDFPTDAKWLTEDEREWVVTRTAIGEKSDQSINARTLLHFFADVKNILAGVMYFSVVIPIYAFAYFAPTIVKTLGYSAVNTQLHTVPPTAAALALCLIMAYLSDRTGLRSPFIGFGLGLIISGLAILITVHHTFSAQYAGLCLVAMGAFSAGPIIICWYVMSLDGHVNRSIGSAWIIGFGNTGGIVATFAFLAKDAPRYHTGYSILLAFVCLGSLATALYMACVWRQVKRIRANDPPEEGRRRYF